jgi:hypothetical protein
MAQLMLLGSAGSLEEVGEDMCERTITTATSTDKCRRGVAELLLSSELCSNSFELGAMADPQI